MQSLWLAVIAAGLVEKILMSSRLHFPGDTPHAPVLAALQAIAAARRNTERHYYGSRQRPHLQPKPFHLDGYNHSAGTPRAGYPLEIQLLWWRLLACSKALMPDRHQRRKPILLARPSSSSFGCGSGLARRRFWGPRGAPVAQCQRDTALRCNVTSRLAWPAAW